MKYTHDNPPIQCFMRQSTWYKKTTNQSNIKGVLFHSTGANNPNIKRYVQPDDNDPDKKKLLDLIGVNQNKNDWNHIERNAGVHAFIGKLASGEVSTVQVGEWTKKAWGCGSGNKGSCNNGWLQFEICEDSLNDQTYFQKVYQESIELTAYLCKLYKLDPLGTVVFNGVKVPVILCHQDSYKLGLGSNHSDVLHWFPKFGKSMDDVGHDVANLLNEEDDEMSYNDFKKYMEQYKQELSKLPPPEWAVSTGEWDKAIKDGITDGTRPQSIPNRAEVAAMIERSKNT